MNIFNLISSDGFVASEVVFMEPGTVPLRNAHCWISGGFLVTLMEDQRLLFFNTSTVKRIVTAAPVEVLEHLAGKESSAAVASGELNVMGK